MFGQRDYPTSLVDTDVSKVSQITWPKTLTYPACD